MFDFQDEDRIITSTMKNEDIDVEKLQKVEMNNLIMFFYMDHQVLVKQL